MPLFVKSKNLKVRMRRLGKSGDSFSLLLLDELVATSDNDLEIILF
jgi:hypothetical protein